MIIVLLAVVTSSYSAIQDTKASIGSHFDIQSVLLPTVNFSWELCPDCRTVIFTSSCDDCVDFSWDFTNDGIIDAWGKTAANRYPNSGRYSVNHCVKIKHSWDCITREIGVAFPNPDFEWEANNLRVRFIDRSTDCDGEITYRGWDFISDGKFDDYGKEVIYEYPLPGSYMVYLVVQDDDGQTSHIRKEVTVIQSIEDLECIGSISWSNVKPNSSLRDAISIINIGDPGSKLDWDIISYPSWGIWEFTPINGEDLIPEEGSVTVAIELTVPDERNTEFTGEIRIINKNDPSDYEIIQTCLSTSKTKHCALFYEDRYPLFFNLLSSFLPID